MNAEEILLSAVEKKTPAERVAYLDGACGSDTDLRAVVEDLLQAHEAAGDFLEQPLFELTPTVDQLPTPEAPDAIIGPYKLREQIGEGGMGLVFVAEQQQPIKRRVALKIIKPGMDTRQVIARFEAERQALALMDHPHIAKVLDAGTISGEPGCVSAGRPYFVMELVKGTPITDYCDTHRLSTRQRLELFLDVCHAVQHAHQKGIIHRDLKPSNILVEIHDVHPVVKVIDFGIAKATGQQLTDKTVYTGIAQLVGTPLYMSPEQAGLSSLDVDTRSDLYSLGVLLYELLTGTTPFYNYALQKAGYDEMRRIIREDEPPRPSTRLCTMEQAALSTIAERRGLEPRRLSQQLRGELDWIVMKALEKDRNRRYESASAFAADVQRFLNDDAVSACPPSAGYRLRKFARRNRRPLVTAGIILAALVTASVISIWQAVVAREAQHQAEADRDRAETAEGRANTKAAIASAVSDFLQEDLLGQVGSAPQDGIESQGDPNLTVKEALDRASAKVAERFRDQPLVEAAIQMAIGDAYGGLNQNRLAAKHQQRALELRLAQLGPDHPDTLLSMRNLAESYTWIGRSSDAIVMFEQLLANAKTKLEPDAPELLDRMNHLATACRRAGDWQRAMRLLEQVVEKDAALRGPTAAGASDSALKLAMLFDDMGKHSEAAARLEKMLALRASSDGPDWYRMQICARAYQRAGKLDEADRLLRAILEHGRKRKDTQGQIGVARTLTHLSNNLLLQSRAAEAEPLAREALALYEKNKVNDRDWLLSFLMNLLGGALLGQKKYADAEKLLLQGYEGMKKEVMTIPAQERYRFSEAGERVVRYYEETNQPEKCRAWRERLLRDNRQK